MICRTLIILLISTALFAQGLPWHLGSRRGSGGRGSSTKFAFKIEADVGYTQINFEEIHESQNFLDTIFTQDSTRYRVKGEFMLLPGWITLGGEYIYTIPSSADVEQTSTSDPGGCCKRYKQQMRKLMQLFIYQLGFINLAALVEYVYSDIDTSSNAYGHTAAEECNTVS